jgi:hypothetical protein
VSIKNKNKDNLKEHGGVELVAPAIAPTSDDPLRFWTGHPTENTLIDLYEFANGTSSIGNPKRAGAWGGDFSGRPELIAELASAIQARFSLTPKATSNQWLVTLRHLWRVCDEVESTVTPEGHAVDRLTSVRHFSHLHETALHRAKVDRTQFGRIASLIDDVRRLLRLGGLLWTRPKGGEPNRLLIPDSHAKALKIRIKPDWERVRKRWERHDAIRAGIEPDTLNEFEKKTHLWFKTMPNKMEF